MKRQAARKREMTVDELRELDPTAADARSEKMEKNRAEARMKLRHKHSGKWAQRVLSRGQMDGETLSALQQEREKKRDLLHKPKGLGDATDSEGDDESDSDGDDGFDDDDEGAHGMGEEGEEGGDDDDDDDDGESVDGEELDRLGEGLESIEAPKTGLFALKFMQKALDKNRPSAKNMLSELREEMGREDAEGEDKKKQKGGGDEETEVGRRRFGGGQKKRNLEAEDEEEAKRRRQEEEESMEEEEDDEDGQGLEGVSERERQRSLRERTTRVSGPIEVEGAVRAPFHVDTFETTTSKQEKQAVEEEADEESSSSSE